MTTDTQQDLERALGDLGNIRAMLDQMSWWIIENMDPDKPMPLAGRDSMIGAVEAMGWAVERVEKAWEADDKARRSDNLDGARVTTEPFP